MHTFLEGVGICKTSWLFVVEGGSEWEIHYLGGRGVSTIFLPENNEAKAAGSWTAAVVAAVVVVVACLGGRWVVPFWMIWNNKEMNNLIKGKIRESSLTVLFFPLFINFACLFNCHSIHALLHEYFIGSIFLITMNIYELFIGPQCTCAILRGQTVNTLWKFRHSKLEIFSINQVFSMLITPGSWKNLLALIHSSC